MTTIALRTGVGGFGHPTINAAGTVAFFATESVFIDDQIVTGNGGSLTTIADTVGQFSGFSGGGYSTAINSAGTVAFWALPDTRPAGIFASSGGTVTPLFLNSVSLSANNEIAFNDAGTVAFRKTNGTGIVTVSGGSITTIVDSAGPLKSFGYAPSMNAAGTVAFVAGVAGIDGGTFGIYIGNGGSLTTIADISGPFSSFDSFNFGQPSINDAGAVAFLSSLDVGGFGIYTGDGTETSEVIGSGDQLFGSTVASLQISPTSLNDTGQLSFYYRLANGTTGIALATPVPEPGSAAVLFGGLLAVLGSRRRRAQ